MFIIRTPNIHQSDNGPLGLRRKEEGAGRVVGGGGIGMSDCEVGGGFGFLCFPLGQRDSLVNRDSILTATLNTSHSSSTPRTSPHVSHFLRLPFDAEDEVFELVGADGLGWKPQNEADGVHYVGLACEK